MTVRDAISFTTHWDDLRVPINAIKLGGVNDPNFTKLLDNGSGSTGVYAYLFDKSAEEEVFFAVQIPHKWKQGTSIHPHVHWIPTVNGGVGTKVSWGLEYGFAEIGNVFGNTSIIYGNTSVPNEDPVANKHYLTELGVISMSGVRSVSSMLFCRLFRDAGGVGGTDDYDADVALAEFDFHYQIDSPGSRNEYTK